MRSTSTILLAGVLAAACSGGGSLGNTKSQHSGSIKLVFTNASPDTMCELQLTSESNADFGDNWLPPGGVPSGKSVEFKVRPGRYKGTWSTCKSKEARPYYAGTIIGDMAIVIEGQTQLFAYIADTVAPTKRAPALGREYKMVRFQGQPIEVVGPAAPVKVDAFAEAEAGLSSQATKESAAQTPDKGSESDKPAGADKPDDAKPTSVDGKARASGKVDAGVGAKPGPVKPETKGAPPKPDAKSGAPTGAAVKPKPAAAKSELKAGASAAAAVTGKPAAATAKSAGGAGAAVKAEAAKPAAATKPAGGAGAAGKAETAKPAAAAKPAVTTKPAAAAKPAVTTKPAAAAKPAAGAAAAVKTDAAKPATTTAKPAAGAAKPGATATVKADATVKANIAPKPVAKPTAP